MPNFHKKEILYTLAVSALTGACATSSSPESPVLNIPISTQSGMMPGAPAPNPVEVMLPTPHISSFKEPIEVLPSGPNVQAEGIGLTIDGCNSGSITAETADTYGLSASQVNLDRVPPNYRLLGNHEMVKGFDITLENFQSRFVLLIQPDLSNMDLVYVINNDDPNQCIHVNLARFQVDIQATSFDPYVFEISQNGVKIYYKFSKNPDYPPTIELLVNPDDLLGAEDIEYPSESKCQIFQKLALDVYKNIKEKHKLISLNPQVVSDTDDNRYIKWESSNGAVFNMYFGSDIVYDHDKGFFYLSMNYWNTLPGNNIESHGRIEFSDAVDVAMFDRPVEVRNNQKLKIWYFMIDGDEYILTADFEQKYMNPTIEIYQLKQ